MEGTFGGCKHLHLDLKREECVMPTPEPTGDLTTAEAGKLMKLCARVVERKCRSGELRAYRTSPRGPYRIEPSAIQEWKARRTVRKYGTSYQREEVLENITFQNGRPIVDIGPPPTARCRK